MPNSSSLPTLMNAQQTSQGKFGTRTMFRKIGSLIKSVRLHLPVLLGFGLKTWPSTSLVGHSPLLIALTYCFLGPNSMPSARTISIELTTRHLPSLLDKSKRRTKRLDQSSKNRRNLQINVHELILLLQQHQHNESLECART